MFKSRLDPSKTAQNWTENLDRVIQSIMRPIVFLAALAPAALAEPHLRTRDLSPEVSLPAPAASIPEIVPREDIRNVPDVDESLSNIQSTRNLLRVRSEGSLGQTPWIGMAIGLTCTAFAAVMLG